MSIGLPSLLQKGPIFAALLLVSCGGPAGGERLAASVDPEAAELTRRILDDETPERERTELVAAHPDKAPELLLAMIHGLEPGTEEEYRRIPWLWRVSIAAGGRNDPAELLRLLDLSLPRRSESLHDWQAVVIGGGFINGISRQGGWPDERLGEILRGHPDLQARWQRALNLSAAMAEDESVPVPTRFDALLMIAMEPWEERGPQLVKYLAPGTDDELQRGAILGLSDMRSPEVARVLLAGMGHYSERGRALAINALIRTEDRAAALLDAVATGTVQAASVSAEQAERLRNHENAALRARARQLLAP